MNQQTKEADEAMLGLIEKLEREHPGQSHEQLFERYQERLAADPVLREAALVGAFNLLCDQVFDNLVRNGKEVPPGLKKPH